MRDLKGVSGMRRRRGQSTAEYAVVLGVVLAALVAMQIYVKRGAQARIKLGVDEFTKAGAAQRSWITNAANLTSGDVVLTNRAQTADGQYEPYYAESNYAVSRQSTVDEDTNLRTGTITKAITPAQKERTTRAVGGYQKTRGQSEAAF